MFQRYRDIKARRSASDMESGFTLIELLIVIIVLGILAAVVIFSLGSVTGESAVAACNADAKTVEVAVEAFNAENGFYPAEVAQLLPNVPTADLPVIGGPYLRSFPNNPNYYTITISEPSGSTNGDSEVDVTPVLSTGKPGTLTNYDLQSNTKGALSGCYDVDQAS